MRATRRRDAAHRRRIGHAALVAGVVALGLFLTPRVQASSEAAWRLFRHDVAQTCLEAATARGYNARAIAVAPYGSADYGMARLSVTQPDAASHHADVLCVYDKQTRAAQIGGPMPAMRPAHDKPPRPGR